MSVRLRLRIEAAAVVSHGESQFARFDLYFYANMAGMSVPGDVRQRFFEDEQEMATAIRFEIYAL
jgi:hypothetical protein